MDIILIVEVLSDNFVQHFWEFIKDGEYAIAEVGDKKSFYRFIQPQTEGYPKMIELFSRKPDLIKANPGMHLTDIPTGEDASSLSAILLDDVFYAFTISNTILSDGLHLANDYALVCLKVRAFLSNKARKQEGYHVQEVDILKHKKDFEIHLNHEILTIKQSKNNLWEVSVRNNISREIKKTFAKFIFIGAGGHAIRMLQKTGIREQQGYAGFPVSGQWLVCSNENIVSQHNADVIYVHNICDPQTS